MTDDVQKLILRYNDVVAQYHNIHQQINSLLHQYNGGTENMPQEQINHYRQLARHRDELYNDMRQLEQMLFTESSDDLTE